MSHYPPTGPGQPYSGPYRPHRGTMILVFAILAWVLGCVIFSIVAWAMGSGDLKEIDAGRMDPEGRGLTQAGKIIGMIHVIVTIAAVALVGLILFVVLILGGFAAASAASGAGGP